MRGVEYRNILEREYKNEKMGSWNFSNLNVFVFN